MVGKNNINNNFIECNWAKNIHKRKIFNVVDSASNNLN